MLTVLSVAFPFAPAGPSAVGGSEQILDAMDETLLASGHRSIVIAREDSHVRGELVPIPRVEAELTEERREWCTRQVQTAIERVLAATPVDLVHMHGMDFHRYTTPSVVPTIVTVHLPVAWHPREIWVDMTQRVEIVCVSQTQARDLAAVGVKARVIENGVALPAFRPERQRENYAVVMGRICPEKNAHEALEAGRRAALPVRLAGQVFPYPEHESYFRDRIQPALALKGAGHRFLHALEREQRYELLRSARCLLHPTLAPETSSLVAMEALACGTPVIAYPSGALEEIVEHGRTGYLVRNVEEMVEAIGRVGALSPAACRAAAEQRFANQRMSAEYLQLYAELSASKKEAKRYA